MGRSKRISRGRRGHRRRSSRPRVRNHHLTRQTAYGSNSRYWQRRTRFESMHPRQHPPGQDLANHQCTPLHLVLLTLLVLLGVISQGHGLQRRYRLCSRGAEWMNIPRGALHFIPDSPV
ncbi:hypothetical protein BDV12DRAFT_172699 [Aspergillus spectabilis]